MATTNGDNANTKTFAMMSAEEVKQELKRGKIQLWKPPYYGVAGGMAAMQKLAQELTSASDEHPAPTVNDTTFAESGNHSAAVATVQKHLVDLQDHALGKLRAKNKLLEELHIQILAGSVNITPPSSGGNDEKKQEEQQQKSKILETWGGASRGEPHQRDGHSYTLPHQP